MYCDEPGCDCRRVYFLVLDGRSGRELALIGYGWESREFYAEWMGDGDLEFVALRQGPVLEMAGVQSEWAPDLLELTAEVLLRDQVYVGRLVRHCASFRLEVERRRQRDQSSATTTTMSTRV